MNKYYFAFKTKGFPGLLLRFKFAYRFWFITCLLVYFASYKSLQNYKHYAGANYNRAAFYFQPFWAPVPRFYFVSDLSYNISKRCYTVLVKSTVNTAATTVKFNDFYYSWAEHGSSYVIN